MEQQKNELKRQVTKLKNEKKTQLSVAYEYLMNGIQLIKYGRRGKPKPMHIYLFEKLICWRDPTDMSLPNLKKKNDRQIPLNSIKEIKEGRDTQVFKKWPIKNKEDERIKFSFSIISDSRTLDLEAPSEIEKLLFIDKLKMVLTD